MRRAKAVRLPGWPSPWPKWRGPLGSVAYRVRRATWAMDAAHRWWYESLLPISERKG